VSREIGENSKKRTIGQLICQMPRNIPDDLQVLDSMMSASRFVSSAFAGIFRARLPELTVLGRFLPGFFPVSKRRGRQTKLYLLN
jgi:hypothetical protein